MTNNRTGHISHDQTLYAVIHASIDGASGSLVRNLAKAQIGWDNYVHRMAL